MARASGLDSAKMRRGEGCASAWRGESERKLAHCSGVGFQRGKGVGMPAAWPISSMDCRTDSISTALRVAEARRRRPSSVRSCGSEKSGEAT